MEATLAENEALKSEVAALKSKYLGQQDGTDDT
jgi:hypothetical protein